MGRKRSISQGDVYICDFGVGIGSEQSGERPCIVIQVNALNNTSKNVIVVPITSKIKKNLPTHILLSKEEYSFLKHSINTVLCENIRAVSKNRLRKFIGTISEKDIENILAIKEYAFKTNIQS